MRTFHQTHSIGRRLTFTITIIACFFMFVFLGVFFSSQTIMNGLGQLHSSIKSITQVRQLRQLLATEQDFLKKSSKLALTPDELVIFQSTHDQLQKFFALNLDLSRNNAIVYHLIADAEKTLSPLNNPITKIFKNEQFEKLDPVVVDQYFLEAQDNLGKVQLVLADESDKIFAQIYDARFIPLTVGLGLSGLFLIFVVWMGSKLKRKINVPIQTLIDAAKSLASGNFSVRAPIAEPNEIGALTHTFNFMADQIEEMTNERKRVALDLLEAKEAAEAANRAKSAFLANMSHEIRTPLGAVMGFADLVVDQQARPSEKANFVAAIRRNGELLSNIINDILDLSKIEAGKMHIERQNVALVEILSDTKTLLDLLAKEKGVSLYVDVDNSLPDTILTDALRLRQILINIIGNAIKFTDKGSVNVIVKKEFIAEKTPQLVILVQDTGCGITAEQTAKLFTPFSQADASTKRKFGGTGLGLVLSKRFANLLGGDVILLESRLNKGSTFKITIDPGPIKNIILEEGNKKILSPIKGKAPPLEGIRVLLAEDSPDNQTLVSHLLRMAGANVDIVSNGKEATEKAMQNAYDVILMDIQMPIMDGYEATAFLRRGGYRGKIVALTAHALNEDRERSLKSGFDDHISKPVNRDILIERVYVGSKFQLQH